MGRLFRGDEEVGLVLVLVEAYSKHVGGSLWWRRWAQPWDAVWLWTVIEGQFSDHWITDEIDEELAAYDAGRYRHQGETLRVRWTVPEEAAHLRRSKFGR